MSRASRTVLALWTVLVLLVAGMMSGTGSIVFAATPPVAGGKAVVTNTDGDPIRIRRGAGTDYGQIASAWEGQSVTILAGPVTDRTGVVWYKVQAPAATGWMMAEFLDGTTSPTLSGTARVANTDGDPLRLRSAPTASARVLTLLDPGTTVSVQDGPVTDEADIVWYKISARGQTGWAMAQYLTQVQPNATPSPADEGAAAPDPVPAPAPAGAPVAQPVSEQTGTADQSGASEARPSADQYRMWMEDARNMYPYSQSVDKMWSVMMCESGGNPRASGGGGRYLGLFQYAPGTWGGSWNPYRNNSIWDAKSQIYATAKAWSIGMQSAWSCYYITSGR